MEIGRQNTNPELYMLNTTLLEIAVNRRLNPPLFD